MDPEKLVAQKREENKKLTLPEDHGIEKVFPKEHLEHVGQDIETIQGYQIRLLNVYNVFMDETVFEIAQKSFLYPRIS